MQDYHSQATATKPAPAPTDVNHDAQGGPAIASYCVMCGLAFTDADLQQLEWPHSDSPAHRACYLEYCDDMNRNSDFGGAL